MTSIYVPSQGPESWQQFLAEPQKQWKTGYSAKSLAYNWEEAKGFPVEIQQSLETAPNPELHELEPLLIIPEHKVPLPGGSTASQNDAFVLARSDFGLVSITIEGKVEEPFGQLVKDWKPDSSAGKQTRLDYLTGLLGLSDKDINHIYYQLLHRTASALIEAERFHANTAVMLVHSFSQDHLWFDAFADFAKALGIIDIKPGIVRPVPMNLGTPLYIGWVTGNPEHLTR